MPTRAQISYRITPEDEIDSVSEGWITFAEANSGGELLPPSILGTLLWESITDETTRSIYRAIIARVRRGLGPVQFQFRCDSPDTRRLLEMRVALHQDRAITFTTTAVLLESRDPIGLLDPSAPRDGTILVSCAWCARVRVREEWREVEDAIDLLGLFDRTELPRLSHGMCPECFAAMQRELAGAGPMGGGVTTLGALP